MFSLAELKDQNVAILGLARSGLASAQCVKTSGGRELCWDDHPQARQAAQDQGFSLVNLQDVSWETISTLILTPGIPHTYPSPHPVVARAKGHGLRPVCDIELFFRAPLRAPVIGVTGTNGKSTTCALITHLARTMGQSVSLGGNIGQPVLALASAHQDLYVLELSSYQLELIPSLDLDVSVLLNLSPDHLERHGGLEGYILAKERIFSNCSKPLKAVINVDQTACLRILKALQKRAQRTPDDKVLSISTTQPVLDGVSVQENCLTETQEGQVIFRTSLPAVRSLRGRHNHQNIAASYAALRLMGLSGSEILQGLESFQGLAHRQEWLGTFQGISYINDSKATNTESVLTALQAYAGSPLYCIWGGRPKEGGLEGLKGAVGHVTHAFLVGEAASDFGLFCALSHVPYTLSGTVQQALEEATRKAHADGHGQGVILFSPGCASFDQFRNFEERGNAVRAWVREKLASHVPS
jgi:UDP-N-acetylmuramoylalanine--D-glutamate ligase